MDTTEPTPIEPTPPAAPPSSLLLKGFAPLAVAVILGILMVLLVPSIAPERVVIQPGSPGSAAPTTTVVAP